MRLIVGMTGATGAPLGVALLQALREMPEVETHLVGSSKPIGNKVDEAFLGRLNDAEREQFVALIIKMMHD